MCPRVSLSVDCHRFDDDYFHFSKLFLFLNDGIIISMNMIHEKLNNKNPLTMHAPNTCHTMHTGR